MKKVVGILAHVDAGKTTFSEQVLYHTNAIRSRGRVDHRNTFLDNQSIERERGITVFAEQAVFSFHNCQYFWIDTPGHADFSAEMERSLQVMDAAVVLISGVEGVEGHTETVFRLLRQKGVPCIFFVNKLDREGADLDRAFYAIKGVLTKDAVCFHHRFDGKEMALSLVEEIAQRDEELLESYLESGYCRELWLAKIRCMVQKGELFPCFGGSALRDQGIIEFLQALHLFTQWELGPEQRLDFSGLAYKVRHDKQGRRVTFLKVTEGVLHAKDSVCFLRENGEAGTEKIDEIRIYNGEKFSTVQEATKGELCGVVGLSRVAPGDGIGSALYKQVYQMIPTMMAKVDFSHSIAPKTVLSALRQLEDEDPMLGVEYNPVVEEVHVHIMGVIQLEVLKQVLFERFQLVVSFGDCETVYQETIKALVTGYGHFEPLRHYAEVQLRLEPGERGSGIVFDSACSTDILDGHYQRLIRTHVLEKRHKGVLTGSQLTDVKITLVTGRAHLKHTEGGDFREATYRAIRQGLMQAQSVLLEPYYHFRISVPGDSIGRVISDIQRMGGHFTSPVQEGNQAVICGRGPVSQFLNYSRDLTAFTRGKGSISCRFDGYEPCGDAQQVVKRLGYEPDRDVDNTPDSVFCAKGAGYPVKWYDVKQYIHCK